VSGKNSGMLAILAAVVYVVLSVVVPPIQDDQLGTLWIVVPFAVVVGVAIFRWLVPWAQETSAGRAARPAQVGITMSVLGLLSVVAFWSGLPIILGAGGTMLGQVGRKRTAGQGRLSTAAVVIGLLAIVLCLLVLPLDRLA